jgi:hypothetical protein
MFCHQHHPEELTYDRELFKDLDETTISKVRIGNGALIEVKGKGRLQLKSFQV